MNTRTITLGIIAFIGMFGAACAQIIDPSTISGMELRLDASAITGLSNGSPVTAWNDTSGNTNNASQTSSLAPIYETGVMNGEPVVQFNGSTQYLNNAAAISGAMTWFVVYQQNSTSGNQTPVGLYGNAIDLLNIGAPYQNVTLAINGAGHGSAGVGFSPTLNTSTNMLSFTYNGGDNSTTSNFQISYNQTSQTVLTSGAAGAGSPGFIGAVDSVGSPINFFNGDIAEIIVYNSVLSNTQVSGVDAYLSNKWVATVPEPSTLALLFGSAGLALLIGKRKRS